MNSPPVIELFAKRAAIALRNEKPRTVVWSREALRGFGRVLSAWTLNEEPQMRWNQIQALLFP
jgi:hypothetical protein